MCEEKGCHRKQWWLEKGSIKREVEEEEVWTVTAENNHPSLGIRIFPCPPCGFTIDLTVKTSRDTN